MIALEAEDLALANRQAPEYRAEDPAPADPETARRRSDIAEEARRTRMAFTVEDASQYQRLRGK